MDVQTHHLKPHERFPNNPDLPLRVYRNAVAVDGDAAAAFERLFAGHGWAGTWRNGIYAFHHYHSNAHEVLGIAAGEADVQFGGPTGPVVTVRAGDAALLPAGATHKRVSASPDLLVIGAYPPGQTRYDLLRGEAEEVDAAKQRIAATPLPTTDPITGHPPPWGEPT